ncbi:MAG: flagellin [Exiguobacterium profundum]|nr:MAG: flagellin [Exiguobacterium profundum]
MSSILTNTSAMVALQTMKSINAGLNATQSEISTGKSVATARDNAAVWSISKVMEADVKGFKGISDSLALGSSTLSVARQAAETVTDLLTEVKGKIVAAQEANADRGKIQTDISALRDQISSVVSAAQFNGLNLVDGSQSTVSVLASLDRSGSNVAVSSITVNAHDLSIGAYSAKGVLAGSDGASTNNDTAGFAIDSGGGTGLIVIDDSTDAFAAGDKVSLTIGGKTATYTVTAEDVASTTAADIVAVGLKQAVEGLGIEGLTIDYDSGSPGELAFTNSGTDDLTVSAQFSNAGAGGLGALSSIDADAVGAQAALGNIESMLQTAISAAADFGSTQGRIDIQGDFVSKLTDSLKAGIGTLVDADMEEASARLQALQVQQQPPTQALSIANQQPQSLLSLFR